jgi:hypothetical protein
MKSFYECAGSQTLRMDLICCRCTHSAWQKPHGRSALQTAPKPSPQSHAFYPCCPRTPNLLDIPPPIVNPGIPDARLSFRTPYHILHAHLPAPEQPHNNRSSYESLETAEGPSVDLYHLSFENSGAATELPA